MGLDVTAVSKLEYRGVIDHGEDGEHHEDEYVAFAYASQKHATKGLRGMDDSYMDGMFIGGHSYFVTEASEFAGVSNSYSGHNRFRDVLAALVRPDLEASDYWVDGFDPETPFYELINFADNEGTIGPESSAALHADFLLYDAPAAATLEGYDLEKYRTWTECCRIAADDGMLSFH